MPRKRLGEILIVAGVLTEVQLKHALKAQQRWGGPLGSVTLRAVGAYFWCSTPDS